MGCKLISVPKSFRYRELVQSWMARQRHGAGPEVKIMSSTKHCVVDLETTSTTPTKGRILTIGAVVGNPKTGEIGESFEVAVVPDGMVMSPDEDDPETVNWWDEIDYDAYQRAWQAPGAVHIEDALIQLEEFLERNKARYLWGNGPDFDLAFLYRFYTELERRVPWKFYEVRDIRTILDLGRRAGVDPKKDMKFEGTKHIAEHDARHEFKMLSVAWQALLGDSNE